MAPPSCSGSRTTLARSRHESRTTSADSLANVRCLLGGQLRSSAGRWRVAEMDVWDNDYLNLIEPAYIPFEGATMARSSSALVSLADQDYGPILSSELYHSGVCWWSDRTCKSSREGSSSLA